MTTYTRIERLQQLALSQKGKLLPDAAEILDREDWQDYWPEVSLDGKLTGDVVSSDDDIVIVDWQDNHLVTHGRACEAAIRSAAWPE